MKANKGSMLEAEQKSLKLAKTIMSIVAILIMSLTFLGWFHTYLYLWHKRAGGAANTIGGILFILCIILPFFEDWISSKANNETIWYILWIILLLAAIATSCGFNFSL
jgi:uncharacterized membrane protein